MRKPSPEGLRNWLHSLQAVSGRAKTHTPCIFNHVRSTSGLDNLSGTALFNVLLIISAIGGYDYLYFMKRKLTSEMSVDRLKVIQQVKKMELGSVSGVSASKPLVPYTVPCWP